MTLSVPSDDSLRLPTNDRAFNAIFIGRADEINRFQFSLNQWKMRMSTVSFSSNQQVNDAIPRRDNKIQGLVVLLYGRGGFGKSTLLKHYCEIAAQPGWNLAISTIIDWQAVPVVAGNRNMFNPPPGQAIDAEAYFMVLRTQLANKLGKSADKFKEFNKAVAAIQNARKQINGELDNARKDQRFDWLFKAGSQEAVALARTAFPVVNAVPGIDTISGAVQQSLELGAKYGIEQVEQLSRRLRDKLHPDVALDYVAPELKLGMSLGKDLAQFAKDLPLLIFIDTYELADEGDPFLRVVMGAAGARVGWVIAGRDNLWAGKDFSMRSSTNIIGYKDIVDYGFAVDFNAGGVGAFTIPNIIDYFTLLYKNVSTLPDTHALHLPPTIGEAEAGRILDVTEGVPLAVQIAAGIYLETGDLNIVTSQDDARQAIVDRMVQRYLQHVQDDPADRARLYGLALLRRSDTRQTDAIAAALGLSEEQGNKGNYDNELRRLHRRYSFIFSEKTQTLLHKEVRDFLRQSLLEQRDDPAIKAINQRLWNAHKISLMSLEEKRQYHDLRERLEEAEWVGVYLDLVEQQFWLEPSEGVNYCLPFMLAEAIYGRAANQERPYANPEAVAVGNFFIRKLQYPYNNRWKWAASSLVYRTSNYPSPEALQGLEELERLVSQHGTLFPAPLVDYHPQLMAALWWRLGEAYEGSDDMKSWAWYEQALKWLGEEKDLRVAAAWISWKIGFQLLNDAKKYAEGLPYINKSIDLNPNDAYAYNGRGVAYKNLKEYELAIKDYNEAIELDPNYEGTYLNRGNVYSILKQYDAAIKDYNEAIKRAPNYIDAYLALGIIYFERKDYELALHEYDKALELDASNANAYYNKALVYAKRKEYESALRDFNRNLELDPHDVDAYNGLGNLYYERKEYDLALQAYNKALELDANNIYAHYNRGLVYFERKQYDLALANYARAIELDPNYVDAYYNKALVYTERKNYDLALSDYARAIELDPNYVDAYLGQGLVYSVRKDYDLALRAYKKVLELDPNNINTHLDRGNLYYDRKEYELALTDYEKVLELDANNVDAHFGQGLVYFERKDYDLALQAYNKALELDPNYVNAYYNKALVYSERKDYDLALTDYAKAIELDPNYVDAYSMQSIIYLELKNREQASINFKHASELDSSNTNYAWMAEWAGIGRERTDAALATRLAAIASIDSISYIGLVCQGVAYGLHGMLKEGLAQLEQAILLSGEEYDAYFWKGMICAYLGRFMAASTAINKALESELPPVLLTPLYWLEHDRPDFFHEHARPVLEKYGV